MLNLPRWQVILIALVLDVYARMQTTADRQFYLEKGKLLLSLERVWPRSTSRSYASFDPPGLTRASTHPEPDSDTDERLPWLVGHDHATHCSPSCGR